VPSCTISLNRIKERSVQRTASATFLYGGSYRYPETRVHPQNEQEVGRSLALIALVKIVVTNHYIV